MTFVRVFSFGLLMVVNGVLGQSDPLVVQTTDGFIQGASTISSWTNKTMYTFLGVPFAAPPVGDLRFKLPVPHPGWNSTLDCTQFRSACMQNVFEGLPGVSEDCLYLNVYSPDLTPTGGLAPVYIFIHGGAFVFGSGAEYNPDQFVAEGIVAVTVNYRLGVFGFLNLGTKDVPGNVGAFDNIFAMKWVQREISKFGGDPKRVTIGGESAGSMLSHLHYLSPASKGLFHQVVGESGASFDCPVTEYAAEYAQLLAEAANCSAADVVYTSQCLRNLTADALLTAQNKVVPVSSEIMRGNFMPFVLAVDKDTNVDNPFLPEMPMKLMESNQGSSMPFLMGTNKDEGVIVLQTSDPPDMGYFTSNMRYLMSPDVLNKSTELEIKQKVQDIKNFYFNGREPSISDIKRYLDLYTDEMFAYPTAVSARSFHKRGNVFLYKFEFHGDVVPSITKQVENEFNLTLVAHSDELPYLIIQTTNTTQDSRDMLTLKRMVKLWSNFIKFGTPTPSPDPLLQNVSWTPVSDSSSCYLLISDNLTLIQQDYALETVKLWDNINNVQSSSATRVQAVLVMVSIVLTLLSI